MMGVKGSVAVVEWHPAARWGLEVAARVWPAVTYAALPGFPGQMPWLTSGQDSRHGDRSFHYGVPEDPRCRAFDVRTRDPDGTWELPRPEVETFRHVLAEALGPLFQVVVETAPPHVHVEFDPRLWARSLAERFGG